MNWRSDLLLAEGLIVVAAIAGIAGAGLGGGVGLIVALVIVAPMYYAARYFEGHTPGDFEGGSAEARRSGRRRR